MAGHTTIKRWVRRGDGVLVLHLCGVGVWTVGGSC